jgi:hypothetical protein
LGETKEMGRGTCTAGRAGNLGLDSALIDHYLISGSARVWEKLLLSFEESNLVLMRWLLLLWDRTLVPLLSNHPHLMIELIMG